MKLKKPVFTDDELIRRTWDVEEIKKIMNRRMHYVSAELRREELNDFWVTEPANRRTASFGRNWGWYVGMDAIEEHYVLKHAKLRQEELDAICAANPAIENKRANLGIGCLISHPPTTALVRLAYDGHTAKGMWYYISQETVAKPDGTADALWMMEKVGVDFIRESTGWKIWHMMIETDFSTGAGADYGKQPIYLSPGENPVENEFGTPTIPFLAHDSTFNWWDNYPPLPEPYFTFTDDISYGPEGHPKYEG